jgi:perosamine synthetase
VVLDDSLSVDRDQLAVQLRNQGVDTRPFFVSMGKLPHLAQFRRVSTRGQGCPVSDRLSVRGLNLPSGGSLERSDIAYVCDVFRRAMG